MAKGNSDNLVQSISDVAPANDVPNGKRYVNPNLEGVRANINKKVVSQLDEYVTKSNLERAVVIEMAIRMFLSGSKDARVAAYDALIAERQPDKATIL